MAKEFDLNVEGCSIWWLDAMGENNSLKEIQFDTDALLMAMSVGFSREMYVAIRIASDGNDNGSGPSASANIYEDTGMSGK